LRRERRQSPRSEADIDFQRAKSELIRLRIAEKQRTVARKLAIILHRMWIDVTEFNWSKKEIAV
jgi:hypothetical protein